MGVEEIIFRYSEVFEFAARWALTEAGDEELLIGVERIASETERWCRTNGDWDFGGDSSPTLIIGSPRRREFLGKNWSQLRVNKPSKPRPNY